MLFNNIFLGDFNVNLQSFVVFTEIDPVVVYVKPYNIVIMTRYSVCVFRIYSYNVRTSPETRLHWSLWVHPSPTVPLLSSGRPGHSILPGSVDSVVDPPTRVRLRL